MVIRWSTVRVDAGNMYPTYLEGTASTIHVQQTVLLLQQQLPESGSILPAGAQPLSMQLLLTAAVTSATAMLTAFLGLRVYFRR
jgi:hypothetical protein